MTDEIRTTAQPGPPSTGTIDNQMCKCCTPQQPLEPPVDGSSMYTCPVTNQKYTFDPAEGEVRRAESTVQRSTETPPKESFFPGGRTREETRNVNPEDPFF